MTIMNGSLLLIYDQIKGDDPCRHGKVFAIKLDNGYVFLVREMREYLTHYLNKGERQIILSFKKTSSPKYGQCWLLESYGTKADMRHEEGRRILIHHGTSENWSENCLIAVHDSITLGKLLGIYERTRRLIVNTIDRSKKLIERVNDWDKEKLMFKLRVVSDANC